MALICRNDQIENADHSRFCSLCHGKLSRLQPGASFYNDRFRIRSLLREDALSLSWLVEDVVNKRKRCVLREYYPEDPSSTALKRQFSQAAKHLAQMSAGPLVPVVFHFTKDNWFYTLEEFIEGQSLRGIVQANGPFSEKQADIAFEGLLKALRTLANLDPPVFHGALDASQALVCQGDYGLLLAGATYLGQAAQSGGTGAIVPVTWERDLSAAARVAVELLTAKTETEQGTSAEDLNSLLAEIERAGLVATLEWILCGGAKRPTTFGEIDAFRRLMQVASEAQAAARTQDAIALLDRAYNLSGSLRIRAMLANLTEQIEVPRTEQPVFRPPVVEESAPLSVPPPSPPSIPLETSTVTAHPEPAAAPPSLKICSQCGGMYDLEAVYCGQCGATLEEKSLSFAFESLKNLDDQTYSDPEPGQPTVQPIPPPAPRVGPEPESAPPPVSRPVVPPPSKGKWGWIAAGVLTLALLFLWYRSSTAQERRFDELVGTGALVSAHDLYKQAVTEKGADSGAVSNMREKARPVLQSRSDEIFRMWYADADIGDTKWSEVSRLQSWLAEISATGENQARAFYAEGQTALIARRNTEALSKYQSASQVKPGWSMALNGVAKACVNLLRPDCAEDYYQRTIQADPNWIFPYQNLGGVYWREGKFDQAEAAYRKALALDPKRPGTHFLLAQMYQSRGKAYREQACSYYRSALELAGDNQRTPFDRDFVQRQISRLCIPPQQ